MNLRREERRHTGAKPQSIVIILGVNHEMDHEMYHEDHSLKRAIQSEVQNTQKRKKCEL